MRVGGHTRLLLLIVGLALGWNTGDARAQEPDLEAAREAYKKAELALSKQEYAIAAREFGVAYTITKDPVLFFKIAEANDKAGNCDAAVVYYRRYLKEGNPEEEYKKITEGAIATCEEKLGVTKKPDDDKKPDDVKKPPPDDDKKPDIITPPPPPPKKKKSEGARWYRTAAWVSLAATVAATTTGVVFGLQARDRQDRVDDLFSDPDTTYDGTVREQYGDLDKEAYTANNYAVTAYIGAGVLGAATVTFFVLDALRGSSSGDSLGLAPVVTDRSVGVSTGWRF